MKSILSFGVLLLLTGASVALGGPGIAGTNVIVAKDPDGAILYQGKLDARGTFKTPDMPPGAYAVLFRSQGSGGLKGDAFSIGIAGGKKKMIASGVPGGKVRRRWSGSEGGCRTLVQPERTDHCGRRRRSRSQRAWRECPGSNDQWQEIRLGARSGWDPVPRVLDSRGRCAL